MNVYQITKCDRCGKAIFVENTVMVHGAQNAGKAFDLLKNCSIENLKKKLCGNCGEFLPCGCLKPYSQA